MLLSHLSRNPSGGSFDWRVDLYATIIAKKVRAPSWRFRCLDSILSHPQIHVEHESSGPFENRQVSAISRDWLLISDSRNAERGSSDGRRAGGCLRQTE